MSIRGFREFKPFQTLFVLIVCLEERQETAGTGYAANHAIGPDVDINVPEVDEGKLVGVWISELREIACVWVLNEVGG